MRVLNHSWSATKQRLHPQSVAEISRHSVLSGDRIRQCETSSGSRHKETIKILIGTDTWHAQLMSVISNDLEWRDEIFSDTKHRAARLRQPSFLLLSQSASVLDTVLVPERFPRRSLSSAKPVCWSSALPAEYGLHSCVFKRDKRRMDVAWTTGLGLSTQRNDLLQSSNASQPLQ